MLYVCTYLCMFTTGYAVYAYVYVCFYLDNFYVMCMFYWVDNSGKFFLIKWVPSEQKDVGKKLKRNNYGRWSHVHFQF